MVGAADLVALPVEDSDPISLEPGLQRAPWNRVFLHAERGHEKAVDHILPDGHDPHGCSHRDHQRLIDRQVPHLPRLQVSGRDRPAVEGEITVIGVAVVPVPLPSLDVDGQIGVPRPVLIIDQPEGRDRDTQQDQDRHHRPGHFQDGVVAGARRVRIGPGAELHHHEAQQPEHEDGNGDDDPEHQIIEVMDRFLHRPGRRLQADAPGGRLPDQLLGQGRAQADQQKKAGEPELPCQGMPQNAHESHPVSPPAALADCTANLPPRTERPGRPAAREP